MRLYIAGYFNTRDRLLPYVSRLWEQGHVITASWLDEELKPGQRLVDTGTHLYKAEELRNFACRDVWDLNRSEAIIMDTIDVTPRGGREVEWGAYVFGPVREGYIVGPKRNVFHELAKAVFPTWELCLDYFKGHRV